MSHQDLSSIEIQTNEAYNQFDSLQPHLPQEVSLFCNKIFISGSKKYNLCK